MFPQPLLPLCTFWRIPKCETAVHKWFLQDGLRRAHIYLLGKTLSYESPDFPLSAKIIFESKVVAMFQS